jgi:transposase
MKDAGNLTMSAKELDRLEIISRVIERRLTQRKAAERLGLSVRQVERLCRAYRRDGASGLVSRQRGRPSNRKLGAFFRDRALDLVRGRYADFGPTLACEKLTEQHGFDLSRETLRRWMIDAGLWIPRSQRDRRAYQPRHRRSCLGELVQIDGCDHAWFEDRGPKCTLLVYVDDATGRLMELRFVPSESAFDYFTSTRAYLDQHGKPVAFYSDKASIFRIARSEAAGGAGITQFSRALSELNIDIVCANTPQAKGRVERTHLTLQDRLVKELRLRSISTPEAGNAYLPIFRADYNRRFGREPLNPHDAHRPLRSDEELDLILTWQEERKLSRNLAFQYKRVMYLVEPGSETLPLAGERCRVHEHEDGRVEVRHANEPLSCSVFFDKHPHTPGLPAAARKKLVQVGPRGIGCSVDGEAITGTTSTRRRRPARIPGRPPCSRPKRPRTPRRRPSPPAAGSGRRARPQPDRECPRTRRSPRRRRARPTPRRRRRERSASRPSTSRPPRRACRPRPGTVARLGFASDATPARTTERAWRGSAAAR